MAPPTAKQPHFSEAIYRRDSMNTLPVDEIIVGERFRQDLGDLSGLMGSIRDIGLLHPVVVTKDNVLLAGQRRLEACTRLGQKDIPAQVVDTLDDALRCLRIQHRRPCRRAPSPRVVPC